MIYDNNKPITQRKACSHIQNLHDDEILISIDFHPQTHIHTRIQCTVVRWNESHIVNINNAYTFRRYRPFSIRQQYFVCSFQLFVMPRRPSSAMSRSENELMSKSQRALEDGKEKAPIDRLRLLCLARGATGIIGLGRAFRRMDDDGNKALSLEEFTKGLHDSGMDCSNDEAQQMFEA